MRWLNALVALLVIAGAARAQDEAQKLYEVMEQKLSKAKAYKMAFDSDSELLTKVKIKGSLLAAAGNRANITCEGTENGSPVKFIYVGDGKAVARKVEIDGKVFKPRDRPTHAKLYEYMTLWLARAGLSLAINRTIGQAINELEPKNPSEVKLSDFKTVGKDKIGGRDSQVIEYKAIVFDAPAHCKLWLDVQSNLPLKRTMDLKVRGELRHISELYTQWELDPKLPDEAFVLPK